MAMVKCKECGKEVSSKAKSCPHCGVKSPGMNAKNSATGCLGIIVFGLIFATAMYIIGDSGEVSIESPTQNQPQITQNQPNATPSKSEFDALSDCQMAGLMLADIKPMLEGLATWVNNNHGASDLDFYNWRNRAGGFEAKMNAFSAKYPGKFKLAMEHSRAAYNLEFRIGQLSRDMGASLRRSPDSPLDISDQYQPIAETFNRIVFDCGLN